MGMSVLIVSATHEEAAHVPAGLDVVVTGLGKTAAAAVVARELALRPQTTAVINIGTAGALRDGVTGLHIPSRVLNHDISAAALRDLGYDAEEWLELDGGADIALASGDVFVSDPTVRATLAEHAHLVDMEGYAVAWAARRAGVPVTLLKHVSDNADDTAFDWPSMVDHSARALGSWLRTNV